MANFQKNGRNVNGQVLTAPTGAVYELGLWGPIDTRTKTELVVSIRPPNPGVSIKRANMVPGQNLRVWQLGGLPVGRTLVEAKDSGGLVWTSVTIEITGPRPASPPRTVFHPGVNHGHPPSGKWSVVQSDPNLGVPPGLRDKKIELLCRALEPLPLTEVALMAKFGDKPLAALHVMHYRTGSGVDFVEDKHLDAMLRSDLKVKAAISARIPKGIKTGKHSGFLKLEQKDYGNQDFRFAFGAIDRLDFEADFSTDSLHVWFKDRYEWHPVYPGLYLPKHADDVPRETNCVHAAFVELKLSGAADFWMVGDANVPLSVVLGGSSSSSGGTDF